MFYFFTYITMLYTDGTDEWSPHRNVRAREWFDTRNGFFFIYYLGQ